VVDGHKRVRTLRRLRQDTVRATAWELSEADALVLERRLRAGESDSAIEQGIVQRRRMAHEKVSTRASAPTLGIEGTTQTQRAAG
jgi:hypothetical protein